MPGRTYPAGVNGADLIRDLAVVLVIAGLAGWVCQRIGLSVVVGYLVAGILIGPHTPPFQLVGSVERVQMLAEFGLVFLIFSIGMGLSLGRLQRLGLSVALATAIGALLMLNLCRLFAMTLGWSSAQGLFLAGILMVSSSAIIAKVLEEVNAVHERWGQLALGVTVADDVVAVVMLTLLSSLVQFGGAGAPAGGSIGPVVGKFSAFVVLLLCLSLLLVPRLLRLLTRGGHLEVRTLLLVGLLLSLAWLATAAGYSSALGAFLLGAIVASTRYRQEVERSFEAMQQTFGAVFFVAIGMLFDFRQLAQAWPLVLGLSALAVIGRPMACALGLIAVGNPNRESVQAGLALTPIGEFSFVIAQLGITAGVIPDSFYGVAVGASLVTSVVGPLLTRHSAAITNGVMKRQPRFVQQAISFYHDRLSRLPGRRDGNVLWKLTGKRFVQVTLHLLFLSALLLFWQPGYRALERMLGENWLFPNALPVLFWSAFGILLTGPLIALWRNLEAIAMILAESATRGSPRRSALQPLVLGALKLVAGVLLLGWLLPLLPLGGATPWVVLAVGAAVLAVGSLFWSRLLRWHNRVEVELRSQFRTAAIGAGVAIPLLDQQDVWNLEMDEVTLPAQSEHGGRRIRELALRQRVGCSIIGMNRSGFVITNPSADEVLYPGDRLLLLGTTEQLTRAEQVLTAGTQVSEAGEAFGDLTDETVRVPANCAVSGRALQELDLIRRFGVQLCGIQRGRERLIMPGATATLEAGDRLLVVGIHDRIQEFRAWLEATPAAAEETRAERTPNLEP